MSATNTKTNSFELFFLGILVGIILTICFSVIFKIEEDNIKKAKGHVLQAVEEITTK